MRLESSQNAGVTRAEDRGEGVLAVGRPLQHAVADLHRPAAARGVAPAGDDRAAQRRPGRVRRPGRGPDVSVRKFSISCAPCSVPIDSG